MDTRYQDPDVTALWSPLETYRAWLQIESAVARAQTEHDLLPRPVGDELAKSLEWLSRQIEENPVGEYSTGLITAYGHSVGHDVAGFIRWAYDKLPNTCRDRIHFGLTSSDVVDTALAMRFAKVWERVEDTADTVVDALNAAAADHGDTFMLGRTHGQPAEPTTLGLRMIQWEARLSHALATMSASHYEMCVTKLSGPVGTYSHNPPIVEQQVAEILGLRPGPLDPTTQVRPRHHLSAWADATAMVVAACAQIATDFRLMAMRGEVIEGGALGRVGSSAMPHKKNPILAEQICGMDRLAQGYAQMLRSVQLWEDRDLSHSCVERVAVPDLLHVLLHTLRSSADLINQALWQPERLNANLAEHGNRPYSAWRVLQLVDQGVGRFDAEMQARIWAEHPAHVDRPPTPEAMVANHPLSRAVIKGALALDSETKGQVR